MHNPGTFSCFAQWYPEEYHLWLLRLTHCRHSPDSCACVCAPDSCVCVCAPDSCTWVCAAVVQVHQLWCSIRMVSSVVSGWYLVWYLCSTRRCVSSG